ncbi:10120_t:CDS:2 [Racocetra fulgida]|uniref:10120_t:CDS:1 n=1 Tax=Racocetra fulgida TaxID=60492 RepID=A0A9N9BBY8_9GLOM|nr:10120_t:CDS:2 [Racocetra fulgida]
MSSLTSLNLELYEVQSKRWPASGRHIMAQYDESTITVYQAFKPSIANYAVENQKFGGPRFQTILSNAVASSYGQSRNIFASEEEWNVALKTSDIRLQWDPDHDLIGGKLNRRAIQLGIRRKFLDQYSNEWIQSIEDITELVKEQHKLVVEEKFDQVMTPFEMVYDVSKELRERIEVQKLLKKAAQDLSLLVSASPPEIFNKSISIKDDAVAVKANVKKSFIVG